MDQKQFETWLGTISEWHKPKPTDPGVRAAVPRDKSQAQTGPEIKRLTYGQDQLCEWCKEKGTCQNRKSYIRIQDPKTQQMVWRGNCNTCKKNYDPKTQTLGPVSRVGTYYQARGLRTAAPGKKLGRKPKPKWWNEGPGVILNSENTDPLTRRAELLDRLEAMRTNK